MTAEIDNYPECVVCGRPETYVKGTGWYCRWCDHDEVDDR